MGDDTLGMTYDMRRQARGAEPPPKEKPWWYKLIWVAAGILVVAAIAALFLGWRAATLVRASRAQLSAWVIKVPAEINARVVDLYVSEGDEVTVGQELMRLDDTALKAAEVSRDIRQSLHAQAEASLVLTTARTAADVERAEAGVEVATAQLKSAEAAVELREAQLTEEIKQAEASRAESAAWLSRLKKGPRVEDIKAAEARLDASRAQEALCKLEVKQSEELVNEGIDSRHTLEIRRTALTTQQKTVRQAELELERMLAGATEEEIEAGEQGLAGRTAAAELARVGATALEGLRAQVAIREAGIADARARLVQAQAQLKQVDVAKGQVLVAAGELKVAERELESMADKVIIRSPINGTVTRRWPKVGELCRVGEICMLVADYSRGYFVNAWVREKDAHLLATGQKARIRLNPGRLRYIDGVVVEISYHTDSKDLDPGGAPSGTTAERVWVKIRPTRDEDVEKGLKHGMTVRALIKVRNIPLGRVKGDRPSD